MVHGLAWFNLIRIFVMPLGSFSFFILNPVSLTLSFLSNEMLFLESSAEEEEELSKDFLVTSLINEKKLKYLTVRQYVYIIVKPQKVYQIPLGHKTFLF